MDYSYQDLRGVNFSDQDLHGDDFTGADLTGANLHHALLSGGGGLDNAIFTDAILVGADLSLVNTNPWPIQGRLDFSGANLMGADLSGANLSFAWFDGADMLGANTTSTIFMGASGYSVVRAVPEPASLWAGVAALAALLKRPRMLR